MSNQVKIDIEQLEKYIGELETLHGQYVDKVYQRGCELGNNSGGTIAQIENLAIEYKNMQTAFVNLVEKTTAYMKNRKDAVISQDNSAKNTIENDSPGPQIGSNKNNGGGGNHRKGKVYATDIDRQSSYLQ